MIDHVLARIEAGLAAGRDGRDAALARDLAALRHADPLGVTAEIHVFDDLALGERLGADTARFEDRLLLTGARPLFRACVVLRETAARRHALEALRATLAVLAAPLLAGTTLDALVSLGGRGARSQFPRRHDRAVAAARAAIAGVPEADVPQARLLAAVESITARAGRLGVRGARWIADDPELFAAIAGAWIDAAIAAGRSRLAFVVPAVAFPGELGFVRSLLDRLSAEAAADGTPIALSVGATIETVRGVLAIDAIERAADFVELELDVLTETCFALSRTDAGRCMPELVARGLVPYDPFADVDPAIAALLEASRRDGRVRSARGTCGLGARSLARLADWGISRIAAPARRAADVRVAYARRGVHPSSSRRVSELARLVTTMPVVSRAPAATMPAGSARDALDALVAGVARGELSAAAALQRLPASSVDALARPTLDDKGRTPLAIGLPVAPGAATGRIALSPSRVAALRDAGDPVVLVVREVYGDEAAAVPFTAGLVSMRGGRTSHAAVVAANCGVPCVIAEHVALDADAVTIGGRRLGDGDWLSIDGSTGAIHGERVPLGPGADPASFAELMRWADDARRLRVLANADTPEAIAAALAAGAEGIGLVRSENMFLEPAQLQALQVLLLGAGDHHRLEELQRAGFAARLAAAAGAPITFRLLDASLYELLPHDAEGLAVLARTLGTSVADLARRVDADRPAEFAMSLRASHLSSLRPELEAAQVRALAAAWLGAARPAPLRVLLPMIISGAEVAAAAVRLRAHVAAVAREHGASMIPIAIGAMMETPRAALDAAEIARAVDFFAWGSNDLTQFTTGVARATFPLVVPRLQAARALDHDPSETLDLGGVGLLVHLAESLGRAASPGLVTGVCGNLAADPRSIRALHALGVDYLSVPAAQLARARLAAAQATVSG